MNTNIETIIEAILRKGTRIASFTYNDVRRNVLIGAAGIARGGVWGVQENRAICRHNGKTFLIARVNNDKESHVKAFDVAKIRDFSPVLS